MNKKDIPSTPTPQHFRARKQRKVDAETFVDKVYYVLNFEMGILKDKAEEKVPLTAQEANKLVKYADCAVKLSREQRERQKDEESLATLSEEALLDKLPANVRAALKA